MTCDIPKPFYLPWTQPGIRVVTSLGDGYSMQIVWNRAFAAPSSYSLAYNIYYSTTPFDMEGQSMDLITEGPKFVSNNTDNLTATILDFTPGDTFYFVVRATEFDPDWYSISDLPQDPSQTDGYLYVYPETLLSEDISIDQTSIPITDTDIFPTNGVIQVGQELIQYVGKSETELLNAVRGFFSTEAREHTTDGYDGYEEQSPIIRFWKGLEKTDLYIAQVQSSFSNKPIFSEVDGYRPQNFDDLIVSDMSANDADRSDFPAYDYVGWRRTQPSRLFTGGCVDTYIGGESFCADGYGLNQQIRGISISDWASRLQETLLEELGTGESVVLLQRLWSGITCECMSINQENPDYRCHKCFIPGTLVRTENGHIPIEQIKPGDMVLADDGHFHKVLQNFENDFDGDLVGVCSSVSANMVWSTPEHPYLALYSAHNPERSCSPGLCNMYINKGDVAQHSYDIRQLPSGLWHARCGFDHKRYCLGSFIDRNDAVLAIDNFRLDHKRHKLDWKDADTLTEHDWLVAKWPTKIQDINTVKIPKWVFNRKGKGGNPRNGPTEFIVDEEFLWIIGLFLAEGSCGSRSINFALHAKETDYANRVLSYFNNLGYNGSIIKRSENGICVNIYSTNLSKWFSVWLGRGCQNKHIPNEFMYLPPKKQMAIYNGIFDGDGCKTRETDIDIIQTSEILALQISEILQRNGYKPLLRRQQAKALTPILKNKRKLAYCVSREKDDFHHTNRSKCWEFEGNYLSKIKKIDYKYYKGKVYNIEVEDRHTYIVQGIIVHNCMGTSFVGGYQQYYNPRRLDSRILVRFTPSQEDIKSMDAGLENYITYPCWTLTYPILNDRDVLIRFKPDGTEEFRYEILNVERNIQLFGQTGKQNFNVQRLRKTSPVYQWRAIKSTADLPVTISTTVGLLRGPNGTTIPHTHTLTISNNISVVSQINQTTDISDGHSHYIIDGVLSETLGHTHSIII